MSKKWLDRRHYKKDGGKTASSFQGKKNPDLLALPREKRLALAFLGDADKDDGRNQLELIPYSNTGVTNE